MKGWCIVIKGAVNKVHIYLHVRYPSIITVNDLVRRLKGRGAKKLLVEFPELRRGYYGGCALLRIEYGARSTDDIAGVMKLDCSEHHRTAPNGEQNFIL